MTNNVYASDLRTGDVVINSAGVELTVKHDAVLKLDGTQAVVYFVGYALPVTVNADRVFSTDRY